eukprot:786670-Rhodomonas_salina.1
MKTACATVCGVPTGTARRADGVSGCEQHIVRGMGVSRIKSYRDEHLLCAHNRFPPYILIPIP